MTVFSFERLWGRIHTQTHSGCWQDLIPWFCRTRTLFSCLLSASGCSLHLEASHWSLRVGPCISGPIEVLCLEPCWECLISPYTLACFCLQLEKVLHFLLAHMIKSAPPEYSHYFKICNLNYIGKVSFAMCGNIFTDSGH